MREIKFRGKRVDNGEWIDGDYCQQDAEYVALIGVWSKLTRSCDWIPVNEESVGQYTGLNDKTGKEIYDLDLVRVDDCVCGNPIDGFKDGVYKVEYCLPDCAFCLVQLDGKNAISFNECMEYEIIGNVFDNPELLTP